MIGMSVVKSSILGNGEFFIALGKLTLPSELLIILSTKHKSPK